ncbi:Hypothetical predicted protein, partial [Mytilus galloprovincialis]
LCLAGCQNGGTCVYEETCACVRGFEGQLCEKATCMSSLGMANNGIPDSALSVSSSKPDHGKEKARHGCCTGQNGGAWCPAIGDTNPWYEVSFDKPQTVSGLDFIYPWYPLRTVATEYMKTFELQFWSALDPVKSWRTFAKDVPSIYNDTLYYTINLQPTIVVNAIRILPLSYKKEPCIRFEILGCDPKGLCSAGYCQNGGSCMGENICLCTRGYYGARCEHTANQLLTLNAGFQTIAHQILQTTSTIKFTVHGNPTLVSTSTGHAIHITSNSQYLVIDKTGFTSCLSDLDKCTNGFTITTNVHFTTLTDNTYIISSGGNLPNTKGIALYYLNGNIHFVVSTSTKTWHLVMPHTLTLNVWHHLELSWNQNLGCELVDNGKLVGSVTQPVPHQATIVKQIAIGHGYTQSTTHISMKVEGFKTVDANRASLVVAGIVSPAVSATTHTSPTPTTTVTMTTEEPTTTVTTNQMTTEFSCGAKEVKFDFMAIKGNVLVTPEYNFTVYKNPTIRPENNGHAVLILNTTGQYVELPNKGIECIQDMTKCESGFTLSLEIKWLDINSTNKRYIFSSGGDKVNNSGLALYLWHGELYCSAKKDKTIWTAKSKLNVKAGEWHSYQVSWNKKDGFVVYLDGQTFMLHSIKLPNPAQPGTFPLLIATTPGYNETSLMEVRNLYTWTASRDVLINHTCITEFPTVPPTTTAYHFTFIKIGHNVMTTTAFNLSVYGQPHLELHSFTKNPILVLNGSNQYVEFSNNSNIGCLNNLADCQSGFTIEVDVSLTKVNQQQKTVIISNSNQYLNETGMALYFFNGYLYGYVSTIHQTWKVDYKFKVDMDKYHNYQISWSVTHGLTLFIDGHQVASTTYSTTHKYTLIQHSLTIGKLHSVSFTTSMKLTALTIWQASHQVLIQQGTLTTAGTTDSPTTLSSKLPTSSASTKIPTLPSLTSTSTTTSETTHTTTKETTTLSTIATTSSEVIKTHHFSFIAISHNILTTSSYNLSVHGSPHLEQNSVLVLNGSNQFVEFSNNSNLGCLNNLAVCQTGFTIKVNVSLTKVNQQQKIVIISNSNQYLNGTGMALYFYNGHLYGYMSTHNQTWKVDYKYKVDVTMWHKYQISWSVAHGLTIFIDGHQVITTTQATIHTYTLIQHALTIGKLHSVSYTTSMKLTGLTIWQASHQVLIQHGILTTAGTTDSPTTLSSKLPTSSVATQITTSTPSISSMSTTTSGTTPTTTKETTIPSTIATTSSEVIKTHHFSFIAISHNILTTSSYNLSVHGSPHLEQNSVLVLNGSNQFVEFSNNSNIGCLNNLAVCQTGFTIKVNVSLTKVNQQQKTVIISNSNQYLNGTGMALYFYNGHMYGYMSTHNQTWKVDYKYKVDVTLWHKYQISWSVAHGLTIFIDGHQVASTTHATTHKYTLIQHSLTIGKLHLVSYTTSMKLTGLTIWQASHQVLIQHGILTTVSTTDSKPTITSTTTLTSKLPTSSVATQMTTSAQRIASTSTNTLGTTPTTTKETTIPITIATTNSEIIKTHHFSFTAISHNILTTSSFNLSVHGSPHLEQHSVLVLNGSNQYVEFSNNSHIGCLNNLAVCQTGFTIKVNVSLIKVNQQQKTVIISNSNQYLNGTGMALYFYNGHLYGYMSTHNQTWKVDYKYKVDVTLWHKYQISWSVAHGLTIFIDGHQVASITHATTHKYTLIQHSLTIGKLHSVSYTTSMKLTGLTIWQASHQVLIQHGILTTAMPTTTTLAPTTTKMDIPKFEWNFVKIPHSQTIIGSMFNATVHGTVNVNTSLGFNFNNTNQYIDLGVHSNLCFGNLSLCSCGLTIKIMIMFTKLEENTVIISSGAEQATGTGLAMVYRYGQIHCMVSTATDSWFTEFSREKFIYHQVHQVIITWSPAHGLKVIINNYVISSVTKSIKHRAIKSFTEHMYIGNTPTVKSLTSCNYFMSSVIIWHCWIDNIVGEGELTTPIPETTTASVTTPVKTAPPTSPAPALTTQFCKTGYVCKDDLTTHPTWKPTNPSKQPTTLKQTQPTNPPTKKPTKPTKPTTPKPTARPTTLKPTKPTTRPTTSKPTTPKPTKPTTRPTTPKPTTPRPSRPSYVTIPHLRPGVSNTGVAYFSCQFEKSKQPNVEFVVCLNINGKCPKPVFVGGSYQEVKFTIVEINQNLFQKQITCTVQARWKGQILVTPIKTSNIITPDIKIVTGNLVLTEGHPTEHLIVNVTAPPQMFCCPGCQGNCKVTITTHANFERFYQRCTSHKYIPEVVVGWAGTSQSPDQNQCGTSVSQTTHISSWQQIIKIPVKATVDGRIDRNTHNHFTVQGHVVNQPSKPSITIKPHTLNVGQVQITANNGDHHAQCKSLNDPHMTTFDGRRYDNHNGGEFTLYKHTSLPYEVRAFYTKCSSRGRAYCNCGAAIKSGDDVITFQTCQRSGNNGQGHGHGGILGFLFNGHGHGHHHHSTPARISVELYKNGELTPGTQIRRIGCGQKYQVILPTGTVVTVQSSGTQFINIWINPSSVDRGQTEGLCGSYDGNRYNDVFYPSNGRPDNNKNPTPFCMKWKQSQTIFYGVSAEKYNYINTFCSCIQNKDVFCNRGHGIMTCAKSRYDITSTILRQAKIPNIGHRHRRDVAEDDTVLTTTVMPVQTNTTTINYTSAEAYNRCKELVEQNKAVQSCWSTVNNTLFNTSMENCAADLVDSGDEVWANGYITDVVEECLNTLANQQQIVDGKVMLPNDTEVVNTTELCQQDCGQHGECIEGVCRCAAGYSGLSCDVSAEDTVPTMIIQPAGTGSCGCDRRTTDDCNTVTVYGDNFVESTTLTCQYEFTQGPVFGKPASLGRPATAQYVSINQVTCTLPEVNDGVYISISNNGQLYSSDWYLHTVYDSVCFDCVSSGQTSPAIQYNRKNFTCVINGQCFAANDKKPDDECKSCDSSNSDNKWTDSSDKSCKCSSETEVSKVGAEEDSVYNKQTVTILAVVIGILCFITMVSLFYNCKLRSKRSLYRKEEYATDDAFNHPQKKNFENPGYSLEQSENVKM